MNPTCRQNLTAVLLLATLAAACGTERTTAPEAASSGWSSLRFHRGDEAAGAEFQDLTIAATGQLVLVDGRGDGSSARGLLADENLETLVRLTDALPPQSYSPPEPCSGGYFLVLAGPDGDRRYASGSCDASAPGPVRDLAEYLSAIAGQVREPRVQPVQFSILLAGAKSGIRTPERVVARSRQDLLAIMTRHSAGAAVAVPRVDFSRQMVIAEFLGDRQNAGEMVDVSGIERNDQGWLNVHLRHTVPGGACAQGAEIQPFVMFAVDRQEGNLLFDSDEIVTSCSSGDEGRSVVPRHEGTVGRSGMCGALGTPGAP